MTELSIGQVAGIINVAVVISEFVTLACNTGVEL